LSIDDNKDKSNRKHGVTGAVGGKHKPKKKKTATKQAKVNKVVNEMLQLVEGEDGVTQEEWESLVDKIGKMFI
jgi:hypothetical protein